MHFNVSSCALSLHLVGGNMAKQIKVRIVHKYRSHYGASLRKPVRKIEISQHAKDTGSFCDKTKTKR